jgi:hypothetical protein
MTEKLLTWFVWHLPMSVVYWATIRAGAIASQGEWSNQPVPDLLLTDVLKRIEPR